MPDEESTRQILGIDTSLPIKQGYEDINDKLGQLEGIAKKNAFVRNELDALISGLGALPFYKQRQALGNTEADFTDWTVHSVENGYNVWKINRSDYALDDKNQLRKDNTIVEFMGEAISDVATTFDKVFIQSGGIFTDRTAEAGTDAGTPFDLLGGVSEEVLIGSNSIFSGADFSFFRPGSGYALQYNYSKVEGWGSGNSQTDILREDATGGWRRDGLTRFNFPGDWAQTDVNGSTNFWLRVKTSVAPTQKAQSFAVQPSTNVRNLLSLSKDQLTTQGLRRWASFGQDMFVTVKNTGEARYEGNLFLQSGASEAQRKAFYVNNHKYEADYKDSTYIVQVRVPADVGVGFGLSDKALQLFDGSTFHTGFKAPALTETTVYKMPTADGVAGDALTTNGVKVLSWTSNASEKSFNLGQTDGAGTTYAGGFYDFAATDNDFSPSTTHGDANVSYAAHFWVVLGAITVDELTLTVTGTSITDQGVRTTSDTQNIVIPVSTAVDTYFETSKKWLGQVIISVASGTAKTCNFGYCKYWDNNNTDFCVAGIEATWIGGTGDSAPDLKLRHHKTTGWTFNVAAPATPPTEIASMATDHGTEKETAAGEQGAWKRDNLLTNVNGAADEGTIIEIVTTAGSGKTFESGTILLRIVPQPV